MEKLRQDKKSKNVLASLNINKRKKQKMQDTVIKQLRGLIKDWSLLTQPHRRLSQEWFSKNSSSSSRGARVYKYPLKPTSGFVGYLPEPVFTRRFL
jgi:hypothetical protein